jgi:hypothetical protein
LTSGSIEPARAKSWAKRAISIGLGVKKGSWPMQMPTKYSLFAAQ